MAQKQFSSRWMVLLLGLLLFLLIGCGGDGGPLPTLAAEVVLPSPTSTSLPPTLDISTATPGSAVVPSNGGGGAAAQTTPKPTVTTTPVNPLININDPNPNQILLLGSEATVRGLVQRESDQPIQISLVSSNGRLLTQIVANPNQFGWQAALVPPPYFSGAAIVRRIRGRYRRFSTAAGAPPRGCCQR